MKYSERVRRELTKSGKKLTGAQIGLIQDIDTLESAVTGVIAASLHDYAVCVAAELIGNHGFIQKDTEIFLRQVGARYDAVLREHEKRLAQKDGDQMRSR